MNSQTKLEKDKDDDDYKHKIILIKKPKFVEIKSLIICCLRKIFAFLRKYIFFLTKVMMKDSQ